MEFYAVKYVDELLDYSDIDKYINIASQANPFLVDNVIPDFITPADLKFILSNLVKERVSIKDITYIFEKLNDYADDCPKSDLLKKIRIALSKHICKKLVNQDGVIQVFEISDKTLEAFTPRFEEDDDYIIKVDGDFAEKLAAKIAKKSKQYGIQSPKILVQMEYRHLFFTLLSNYLNDITVITREEIGCNFPIEIVTNI